MSEIQVERYIRSDINFNRNFLERIILKLADEFNIRIAWNVETAVLTGVFGVAGGLVGGYAGGRLGAMVGTGVGSAVGFGISTVVSLREIWNDVKAKLTELFFVVLNFLRRLDRSDYERAFHILMACVKSRRELVYAILDLIAVKLNREVFSSLTHSRHGISL